LHFSFSRITVSRFKGKDEDNEYEEWKDKKDEKKLIDDNDAARTWFSFATAGAPTKLIKKKNLQERYLRSLMTSMTLARR